ncbi:MAG: hypothetical protein Q3965_06540 [Rothia sp. (in: high G+C Gram-positive bacteria)]|nr:hypothetical protein [Rothia sp. (in: high G+C Gram-positive bacteria)]
MGVVYLFLDIRTFDSRATRAHACHKTLSQTRAERSYAIHASPEPAAGGVSRSARLISTLRVNPS